ncbi:MAG: AMP-binding protein [Bacteroidales bacterium]|nr:AMP-binding protein [Bacteroidales bacterium]
MKRTVLEMLTTASQNFRDNIYVSDKTDKGWEGLTFSDVENHSSYLAVGLIKEGVHPDDKVAIISEGRSNWIISEYAVLKTKAVCVPLSVKLQPEEIAFRLEHSESKFLIVSKNCIKVAFEIKDKLKSLGVKIVYLDKADEDFEKYKADFKNIELYDVLLKFGQSHFSEYRNVLQERISQVTEDDVVTISYTSGTTGNPKGIMLTHLNYWANSHDAVQFFRLENGFRTLVILPLDHSFAHTIGFFCATLCCISLYFVDARGGMRNQLKNLVPNIAEVKPDFMLSVPAITGNFMRGIQDKLAKQGGFANWLFKTGLNNGIKYYGDGFRKPGIFNILFRYPIYKLADVLVFKKVRKFFGGNFKFFIGGGAMLDVKQQQFFNCIGAPVMQGYGQSEATPVISVNQRHRHKFGSSGGVLNGIDCRIMDQNGNELPVGQKGYITVKGLNVMKGYFKNDKATAEAVNAEGRLNTFDMGYIDQDGFLVVTGREKALLISADGEKYSPEEIEDAIVNCGELFQHCVLYNDHCKYTTAMVSLDVNRVKNYARENNITSGEKMLEVVKKAFLKFTSDFNYKDQFPKQWIPSVFAISPEQFTEANGMVNSTMKLMRFKVIEKYKSEFERMNTPQGKADESKNIEILQEMIKQ